MLGGSLGLALCSALLVATGSYALVFCVIGLATLTIVAIAAHNFAAEPA